MKQVWSLEELVEFFTLSPDELVWISGRTQKHQLGLAIYFKIFQYQGHFPEEQKNIPVELVAHIATQLQASPEEFSVYDWTGRSASRDRQAIYNRLSYRIATVDDANDLSHWISQHPILREDQRIETLIELAYERCRDLRIDPPTSLRLRRIIRTGVTQYETVFFETIFSKLNATIRLGLDNLLYTDPTLMFATEGQTVLGWIKQDAGKASVSSVRETAERLRRLQALPLPYDLFNATTQRAIKMYARRLASERPYEILRRSPAMRYTLLAAYCWIRRQDITDQLVELFIQIVHKINAKAEKRIDQKMIAEIQRQQSEDLIIRLLQAAHDNPKGVIEDVIYPIASPRELKRLIEKQKSTSWRSYERQVYYVMRTSYQYHYRAMLPILLEVLQFQSQSQPAIIHAIDLVQRYMQSRRHFYPIDKDIPIEGVIPNKWQSFILEDDLEGRQRVNRINYEVCMLQTLRDYVRSRAVWIVGAQEYRNPDEDLPADFDIQREYYYHRLQLPLNPDDFANMLQQLTHEALTELDQTVADNPYVRFSQQDGHWIHITPSVA